MGQGKTSKYRPSNAEVEVGVRLAEAGDESLADCVEFDLADCTHFAESLRVDQEVFGDFSVPRVTILSEAGVVGYAPVSVSKVLIGRAVDSRSRIRGKVIKMRRPRAVRVEICF